MYHTESDNALQAEKKMPHLTHFPQYEAKIRLLQNKLIRAGVPVQIEVRILRMYETQHEYKSWHIELGSIHGTVEPPWYELKAPQDELMEPLFFTYTPNHDGVQKLFLKIRSHQTMTILAEYTILLNKT